MDAFNSAELSPRRAQLASFEHAYAVAVRQRESGRGHQFVIRTGNSMQPFRIVEGRDLGYAEVLARVA